jgi:hypothetical protein
LLEDHIQFNEQRKYAASSNKCHILSFLCENCIYSPFKVDSLWLDTAGSVLMLLDTFADASYFDLEKYLQPLIVPELS